MSADITQAADTGIVERVAEAIGAAMHRNPLSIETRRALARAAIEAMRDPTPEMEDAVNAWCALIDLPKAGPRTIWLLQNAIVNAALGKLI